MAIDWWRSYHGAPTDPKWIPIARRAKTVPGVVSAVWFALEDYASAQEDRGSVAGFDVETYAAFSGWDEDQVHAIIAALEAKGLIFGGRLSSWSRRQPKREDDTAADRKRKQRSRLRDSVTDPAPEHVTQRHTASHAVTPEKSREEEKREEDVPMAAPSGPAAPVENSNNEPVDLTRAAELRTLRGEAIAMVRGTWRLGKPPKEWSAWSKPPRPWTDSREGSIWNDLVKYDPPEDLNAAARVAIRRNRSRPWSFAFFHADRPGAQEFYRQCLQQATDEAIDHLIPVGRELGR